MHLPRRIVMIACAVSALTSCTREQGGQADKGHKATKSTGDVQPYQQTDGSLARAVYWRLHEGWVSDLCFFRGLLGSGSMDHTAAIWDPAEKGRISVFTGHKDGVTSIVSVPTSDVVATAGFDATVRIWDPVTGQERVLFKGHHNEILSLAVSGDGKTIVSGGHDPEVYVWDTTEWTAKAVLRGCDDSVFAVAAVGSDRVVAAGADATVRLWQVGGTERASVELWRTKLSSGVHCLAVAPNGEVVAAGTSRETTVMTAASGIVRWTWEFPPEQGRIVGMSFIRDSELLFVAQSGHIYEWMLEHETPSLLGVHKGGGCSLACDRKLGLVAVGGADGTVLIWGR